MSQPWVYEFNKRLQDQQEKVEDYADSEKPSMCIPDENKKNLNEFAFINRWNNVRKEMLKD